MNPNVSYQDVLTDIQDFYVENSLSVYVPSADKSMKFKPISVSQMKKFIEIQVRTSKDEVGIIPGLEMVNDLNRLLQENYVGEDPQGLLGRLTILDRDAIVAQLRADNNPIIEIPKQDEDEPDTGTIEHLLKDFKKAKLPASLKTSESTLKFKSGHIKLKLSIPSLYVDSYINEYFKAQIKPFLNKGSKGIERNLEKILSQTYLVELAKYIDALEIQKNSKSSTVITFDNYQTLTQQLKLLEQLPSNVIVKINKFIKQLKDYRDSILYYVDGDGKQQPLNVDVSLFTSI